MKKLFVLAMFIGYLFGWETTTHRAIDQTALKSDNVVNLKKFVAVAGIENEDYSQEIFEEYTNKETGKPIKYLEYFNSDFSDDAMADWNQTFRGIASYQAMIEAGTMLEDAAWPNLPLWGANGRFLNHFYDPQNGGKGLRILGVQFQNATVWARWGPGNEYSYFRALEYFNRGFTSKTVAERRRYQAKMFVSVGHIMHLLNDMNVPAHTRDDAHPNGDALEWWARGGQNGQESMGFYVEGSILRNYADIAIPQKPYYYGNMTERGNGGQLHDYMIQEAEFTGTHFFSGYSVDNRLDHIDTIEKKALPENYHEEPCRNSDVPNVEKCYIVSDDLTSHNKLAIRIKSYFYNALGEKVYTDSDTRMRGGDMTTFRGDMRVLEDNAYHLIPRAIKNAEGFLNYFFRGQMKAEFSACGVTITNTSDPDTVAGAKTVTFQKGGTFYLMYDDAKGRRRLLASEPLTRSLPPGDSIEIPLRIDRAVYEAMDDRKEIVILFDGTIGTERGLSVARSAVEEAETFEIPGGLFTARLSWHQTAVHMELESPLMSRSVSGCGIAAAGSEAMTLYDVYPGTYPVHVTNVRGYEDLDDTNLSDRITLSVYAVNTGERGQFTVTDRYQYPDLGAGGGHVADIVITRSDAHEPSVDVVPTVPYNEYFGKYGGGGRWPYPYITGFDGGYDLGAGGTGGNRPLQREDLCEYPGSCGCLPCRYKILLYLNQVRLGPIAGARVRLYRADEEGMAEPKILYEGETTLGDDITQVGRILLPVPAPGKPVDRYSDEERAFMQAIEGYNGDFILEVGGGFDIDSDDDLSVDSTFRQLNGKLRLILSKKRLMNNDYKVNILTEIAYRLSKDLLGKHYDPKRLQERLDDIAGRVLIDKIYPTIRQPIGRDDLMWWVPAAHKKWLVKPYRTTLAPLVDKVYAGEDIDEDAYRYVYDPVPKTDTGVPILRSQWFRADENLSGGSYLGRVIVVSEGNSSIRRYLLEGDGAERFVVGSDGKVFLEKNTTLDYESRSSYQLQIRAVNDAGVSRPATLYILVNNVPDVPDVRGFEGGPIAEDAPEGTWAGQIVFDEGAAPIDDMELSGADAQSFRIDRNGTLRVSSHSTLDYERAPSAHLVVRAHNALGYSRPVAITLAVTDAVDVPIVGVLDVRLDENADAGGIVGKIDIRSNDPVTGVELRGDGAENFTVDTDGIVRVAAGADLDYERRTGYVLSVYATNVQGTGRPGTLIVRINNIPDVPEVKHSEFHILEGSPAGSVVGHVRLRSQGSAPVQRYTLSGKGSEDFRIDDNGTIYAAVTMPSWDERRYYDLYVRAVNAEGESRPKINVVYIDSLRPRLGILDGWVHENAERGTRIGRVPVASEGGAPIDRFVLEGEGSDCFIIGRNGVLRVSGTAKLDFEAQSSYQMQVRAYNRYGASQRQPLYVRIVDRDDSLKIRGFSTRIHEDIASGSIIGYIVVLGRGGVRIDHFEISGAGAELFAVDSRGRVRVARSDFDSMRTRSYHLKIVAVGENGLRSNEVFADIVIDESPAERPILSATHFSVDENAATGVSVGSVQVVDPGSGPVRRFEIVGDVPFVIDGNGTVRLDGVLDYERKRAYEFSVIAYNTQTYSDPVPVRIAVRNVPDTPPVLEPASFAVDENSIPGSVVGHLRIVSAGEGNITGFVLEGEGSGDFTIDRNGTIYVAGGIDYETTGDYRFDVRAVTDIGKSSPNVPLSISVNDLPDVPPVIRPFAGSFDELSDGDEVLGRIEIVREGDRPVEAYEVNGTDLFHVDPDGTIRFAKGPICSPKRDYRFRVRARSESGASGAVEVRLEQIFRGDIRFDGLSEANLSLSRIEDNGTQSPIWRQIGLSPDENATFFTGLCAMRTDRFYLYTVRGVSPQTGEAVTLSALVDGAKRNRLSGVTVSLLSEILYEALHRYVRYGVGRLREAYAEYASDLTGVAVETFDPSGNLHQLKEPFRSRWEALEASFRNRGIALYALRSEAYHGSNTYRGLRRKFALNMLKHGERLYVYERYFGYENGSEKQLNGIGIYDSDTMERCGMYEIPDIVYDMRLTDDGRRLIYLDQSSLSVLTVDGCMLHLTSQVKSDSFNFALSEDGREIHVGVSGDTLAHYRVESDGSLTLEDTQKIPGRIVALLRHGTHLYLMTVEGVLYKFRLKEDGKIVEAGQVTIPSQTRGFVFNRLSRDGRYLYANDLMRITVVDLDAMRVEGVIPLLFVSDMDVGDPDRMIVMNLLGDMFTVERDPAAGFSISRMDVPDGAYGMTFVRDGGFCYIAGRDIAVFEPDDGLSFAWKRAWHIGDRFLEGMTLGIDLNTNESTLAVSRFLNQELRFLNVSDPFRLQLKTRIKTEHDPYDLIYDEKRNLVYVNGTDSLELLEVSDPEHPVVLDSKSGEITGFLYRIQDAEKFYGRHENSDFYLYDMNLSGGNIAHAATVRFPKNISDIAVAGKGEVVAGYNPGERKVYLFRDGETEEYSLRFDIYRAVFSPADKKLYIIDMEKNLYSASLDNFYESLIRHVKLPGLVIDMTVGKNGILYFSNIFSGVSLIDTLFFEREKQPPMISAPRPGEVPGQTSGSGRAIGR